MVVSLSREESLQFVYHRIQAFVTTYIIAMHVFRGLYECRVTRNRVTE